MHEFAHNHWLVLASLAIAMMAGFTGLSILKGASGRPFSERKKSISLAAVALGGGIWSMHFVAMLGIKLPTEFFYDPVTTLASAFVAVLFVGAALLVLHFYPRSHRTITIGGLLVGVGILAMHYLGMSGIRGTVPVYSTGGIAMAIVISLALSVATLWVTYHNRTRRNILLGTVAFGLSVFTVHFAAMATTGFAPANLTALPATQLSNETLAMIVTVGSFLICGSFLLSGATFLPSNETATLMQPPAPTAPKHQVSDFLEPEAKPAKAIPAAETASALQVPFERDGKTFFLPVGKIAAVRAEGHYTIMYHESGKVFCPWSISIAQERLAPHGFIKVHRSYLVNPASVSGFDRTKDTGVCLFDAYASLQKIPVSRSHLPDVRAALGLD